MMRACVLVLLWAGVAAAQGYQQRPPSPRQVSIDAPDGGVLVNVTSAPPVTGAVAVSGTVDARVTTPPDTFLAVAGNAAGDVLRVEVPAGVAINGTANVAFPSVPTIALQNGTQVGLGQATLNLLAGQRICTNYPVGNNLIDGGVFSVPTFAGQTGASVTVHDFGASVDWVSCWPSGADGGPLPSCAIGPTEANIPLHNQGNMALDGLSNSTVIKCRTCTHAGPPSGGTALLGGNISVCTPLP